MASRPARNPLPDLSDDALVAELRGMEEAIYQVDCFGVSDIVYLEMIYRELDRRGLRVRRTLLLHKVGDEE